MNFIVEFFQDRIFTTNPILLFIILKKGTKGSMMNYCGLLVWYVDDELEYSFSERTSPDKHYTMPLCITAHKSYVHRPDRHKRIQKHT